MILPVFGLMLGLALGLIVLGLIQQDHSELAIIGFLFLIFLAGTLRGGDLEVRTGTNITVAGNHTVEVYTYTPENNTTSYGWWLTVLAAVSIAILLWKLGSSKDEQIEEGTL